MTIEEQFSIGGLRHAGFQGFVPFQALRTDGFRQVPPAGGVYVVVRKTADDPVFLSESPSGRFKGRNPTQPLGWLETKWVLGASLLYVGKSDSLRRRLRQYADFGAGRPVGHWGGRAIWQLADAVNLLVAWRSSAGPNAPLVDETALLIDFVRAYGRLPFANIALPAGRAA